MNDASRGERVMGPQLISHQRRGAVLAAMALPLVPTLLALVPTQTGAQEPLTEEVRVKAAYLHKFPGFVAWPEPAAPRPSDPFVVGVAGSDVIFLELERIARGRLVQGRPVEARRVRQATVKSLNGIHVLFVGRELGSDAIAFLKAADGLPVLTVGEDPRLQRLVVLNFVERSGTVRFEASLSVAKAAGLSLNARLLAIAERVYGSPAPAGENN